MQVRPITRTRLVEEVAERIAGYRPAERVRVAIDGPPPAEPDALADALVDPLRVRGRASLRIRSSDFLRPASLRFEAGRTNPDALYERWLDESGLRREVLDRLRPGGDGRVLPSLWDPETDRATRAPYVAVPADGALLVSGALLLGSGLPFDLTVHLSLSPAALARRTALADRWALPAYARYEAEVRPASVADVVVRLDDPRRPAVVVKPGF
jgi:hypothetical protein